MRKRRRHITLLYLYLFLGISTAFGAAFAPRTDKSKEPAGLILTWQQDPLTTMTIDWQTEPDDEALPVLYYQKVSDELWKEVKADQRKFPYSARTIHRVELTALEPGTYYRFRMGEFTRVYKFRTMPENIVDAPLVFATGGDTRPSKWTFEEHYRKELGLGSMEDLNKIALDYDVDFIAWSGDFAYADGREDMLYRWEWWFESNMNSLIDEDGRVVPLLLGVGTMRRSKGHTPKAKISNRLMHGAKGMRRISTPSSHFRDSRDSRSLISVIISAW